MRMKREKEVRAEYRKWLIQKAENLLSDFGEYKELCEYLYSKPFRWVIEEDANRAKDGTYLRTVFADETDDVSYHDIALYLDASDIPCNILEMMVALAVRCEKYIMQDPDYGDRTNLWLFGMINSLGLDIMTDGHFSEERANEIIDILLDRKYSPNGKGSLFSNDILEPTEDFTKLEIWYQLNWYLSTIPF